MIKGKKFANLHLEDVPVFDPNENENNETNAKSKRPKFSNAIRTNKLLDHRNTQNESNQSQKQVRITPQWKHANKSVKPNKYLRHIGEREGIHKL